MAQTLALPTDFDYWCEYNKAMLAPAERLLILCLEGWQDSRGVAEEALFANANNITVNFIVPRTYKISDEAP